MKLVLLSFSRVKCCTRLVPDLCGPAIGLAYKAVNLSHWKETAMRLLVTCLLVLLLLILHQDYWQWDRNEILFGFLPYTMAYNIGISLATGLLWIVVCTLLWPKHLEEVGFPQNSVQSEDSAQ